MTMSPEPTIEFGTTKPWGHLWGAFHFGITICYVPFLSSKTGWIDQTFFEAPWLSPWMIWAVVGMAITGMLMAPQTRLLATFTGALAGYCSFWLACHWASGSRNTSITETLIAGGLGLLPAFLLHQCLAHRRVLAQILRPSVLAQLVRRPPPVEVVRHPPPDQSQTVDDPSLEITTRHVHFVGLFCILANVIFIWDLDDMESRSARLSTRNPIDPLASLYDRFGYWGALPVAPAISLFVLGVLALALMGQNKSKP
jgi:hypothetical protein